MTVLISEPHAGFRIAFNMFDADGNEMVDKKEFLVVWASFDDQKQCNAFEVFYYILHNNLIFSPAGTHFP